MQKASRTFFNADFLFLKLKFTFDLNVPKVNSIRNERKRERERKKERKRKRER